MLRLVRIVIISDAGRHPIHKEKCGAHQVLNVSNRLYVPAMTWPPELPIGNLFDQPVNISVVRRPEYYARSYDNGLPIRALSSPSCDFSLGGQL